LRKAREVVVIDLLLIITYQCMLLCYLFIFLRVKIQ
jgi:hypothetical protein